MAKVYFSTAVKYNGTKYPANAPFEVADKDVDNLRKSGGWVVEEPAKTVQEETAETKTATKKPGKAKVKEAK